MTAPIAYLVQSAGWAGAGFVGGLVVGRTARDVRHIAQAVQPEPPTTPDRPGHASGGPDMPSTPDQPPASPPPQPERRARRWARRLDRVTSQRMTAIVVLLLAIATVAQGVVEGQATQRLTHCQSSYSNRLADAIDARSTASATAQDALDQLVTAVGAALHGGQVGAGDFQRAIAQYQTKRAALKRQQAEHPYPAPPRTVCQ
jgi:hypothetical protein